MLWEEIILLVVLVILVRVLSELLVQNLKKDFGNFSEILTKGGMRHCSPTN